MTDKCIDKYILKSLYFLSMVRDGKIKVKDFVQLEQRRMEAIRLLEQGMKQADIGRRLGVTRQAVNTW